SAPAARSATTSAAASVGGELASLRARGTLIVAIRVEAPPAERTAGDPAHGQKRAFEAAVAALIASRILAAAGKIQLRRTGRDRLSGLSQGADIAMTVDTAAARD